MDKELIDCIGTVGGNLLLKHSIEMAAELGISVIAEGVETTEQRDFLRRHGCNAIQGYLYSRPLDADAFSELLYGKRLGTDAETRNPK